MEYKQIRAVYDKDVIRVYQAYNDSIAEEAVKLNRFGNRFKMERMTWIKPSFLWMMYRSGWAQKEGQERILAINIYRKDFDYILENAVLSTCHEQDKIEWQKKVKQSEIRCQWDPERDIYGNPLSYRSVQIGLKGTMVKEYVNHWIVSIEDMTPKVREMKERIQKKLSIDELLPQEEIYDMTEKAKKNLIG